MFPAGARHTACTKLLELLSSVLPSAVSRVYDQAFASVRLAVCLVAGICFSSELALKNPQNACPDSSQPRR